MCRDWNTAEEADVWWDALSGGEKGGLLGAPQGAEMTNSLALNLGQAHLDILHDSNVLLVSGQKYARWG